MDRESFLAKVTSRERPTLVAGLSESTNQRNKTDQRNKSDATVR